MIPLSMNRNRTGNLLMLLLALYLASPADIIPDFIPAAGWIDDIFVILWTVVKRMDRTNKKSGSVLGFLDGLFTVGVILTILLSAIIVLLIVSLFK